MRRMTLLSLLLLGGCATDMQDIGREPRMSAVGTGLTAYAETLPKSQAPSRVAQRGNGSLWVDASSDLFRDPRAMRAGDLLTVNISINDRAQIGNSSDRSKEAKAKSSLDFLVGLFGLNNSGQGSYQVESSSLAKGKGNIDRSEKIQLSIAAVVTDVLPNGNFLISGSQEIRVNFELRSLEIKGIVRPRDISRDNTIPYDKIAEARVSYGGRGRVTEVQQPGLMHQVHDLIKPF